MSNQNCKTLPGSQFSNILNLGLVFGSTISANIILLCKTANKKIYDIYIHYPFSLKVVVNSSIFRVKWVKSRRIFLFSYLPIHFQVFLWNVLFPKQKVVIIMVWPRLCTFQKRYIFVFLG